MKKIFHPDEPFLNVFSKVWIVAFFLLIIVDLGSKIWITETLNFHLAPHQVRNVELNRSMTALYDGQDFIPLLGENGSLAKFRLVFNDRFVFGSGPSMPVMGIFFTFFAIVFLFFYRWHNPYLGHPLAWLLVFSGATGNLLDKLFVKSLAGRGWGFSLFPQPDHVSGVVDFIEVIWFGFDNFRGVFGLNFLSWETWPTFNIADSFIVVGITLLIFTMKEYGTVRNSDQNDAFDGNNEHTV